MQIGDGLADVGTKVEKVNSQIEAVISTLSSIKYPTDDEIFIGSDMVTGIVDNLSAVPAKITAIANKVTTIADLLERAERGATEFAGELAGFSVDPWTQIDLRQAEMLRGLSEEELAKRGYQGNILGGVTYVEPRLTAKDYEQHKKDLGNIAKDKKLNEVLENLGVTVPEDPVPGVEYKYVDGKNGNPSRIEIGESFIIYSDGTVKAKIQDEEYKQYTKEDIFKTVKEDRDIDNVKAIRDIKSKDSDFAKYLEECGITENVGGDFKVAKDNNGNISYVEYNGYKIYNDDKNTILKSGDDAPQYKYEEVDPMMVKALVNDGIGGNDQFARATGITETDLYDRVPDNKRGNLTMPIYEIKMENGSRYTYSDTITPYVDGFNNVEGRKMGYLVDEDGKLQTGYVVDPNSYSSGIQGVYANGFDTFLVFRQGGAGPWAGTHIQEPSQTISGAGCGITSLSTILHGLDVDVIPQDFKDMRSADDGVQQAHMDRYGMEYRVLDDFDDVLHELEQGHQVLYHLHGTSAGATYSGHYVSLLGMDENGNIFVGDPAQPGNVGYHSQSEFKGFWSAIAVWEGTGSSWIEPEEAKNRYFRNYEEGDSEDNTTIDNYTQWKNKQDEEIKNVYSADILSPGTSTPFDDEQYEEFMEEQRERTGLGGKSDKLEKVESATDAGDTVRRRDTSGTGTSSGGGNTKGERNTSGGGKVASNGETEKIENVEDVSNNASDYEWTGKKLTKKAGRIKGKDTPSGYDETYYNLDMSNCIKYMKLSPDKVSVRDDGVKLYDGYVMVATPDQEKFPKGSYIETTLGLGYVVDVCPEGNLDIAVTW